MCRSDNDGSYWKYHIIFGGGLQEGRGKLLKIYGETLAYAGEQS